MWQYGGGTLSQTIEVVNGTDLFSGSTATAKIGYRFDGWYLDEACTMPVGDKGTVTGGKLVPTTLNLDAMPKVNTFWAKFVPVPDSIFRSTPGEVSVSCGRLLISVPYFK